MPRVFIQTPSIIRFFWTENDIRELQLNPDFCPYISISGTYFVDLITYPAKSAKYKSWELREIIGNKYKFLLSDNKDTFAQNIKFRFTIQLPPKIYVNDLENVMVGRYVVETKSWSFDAPLQKNKEILSKENKIISFWSTDVGIYSLLINRSTYFPYKNWKLRCIATNLAWFTLESNLCIKYLSSRNPIHL